MPCGRPVDEYVLARSERPGGCPASGAAGGPATGDWPAALNQRTSVLLYRGCPGGGEGLARGAAAGRSPRAWPRRVAPARVAPARARFSLLLMAEY